MQLSQLLSVRCSHCSLFLVLTCAEQQQPSQQLLCVLMLQDSMALLNRQRSRIA